MSFTKRDFVAGCCLVASSLTHADTLYTELNYLTNEHPLIQSAAAQKESADERIKVARSELLPNVLIAADKGREEQERPTGGTSDLDAETAYLQVRQLIWDFGASTGALQTNQVLSERADMNRTQVTQDLLLTGIRAYFELVLAYERVDLAKESEQRVADTRDLEQKKLDAGRGSQADVFQAESQRLGAETRVVQSEGALEISRNTYEQVFGKNAPLYSPMEKSKLPTGSVPTNLQEAIDLALENDPTLRVSRFTNEAASKQVKVAKAAYYPRFDVLAESEYRHNDSGIEGTIDENRILVTVDYDFDVTFSKRNAVAAARAEERAAIFNSQNQERVTKEAVQNAWERYIIAQSTFDLSKRQTAKAEEFLELAKKERELGRRTLQDILSGELLLLNAKVSQAEARVELSIAAYAILRSTGQLELGVI